jgi:hypothetical protein
MRESFEARHHDTISKLKLILIVVCLIAIPITFWVNHSDVGSVNRRITTVESPCLRYGARSSQCREAFEQAVLTITHAQACAILRKAGLEIIECAHARLRQELRRSKEREKTRAAKGGGALQTGSTGHQPPSPQQGGSPGQGSTERTAPPEPPAVPAPSAPLAPAPLRETVEDVGTTVHGTVCSLPVQLCP